MTGQSLRISASFLARDQPLIRRSVAIASLMSWHSSAHTSSTGRREAV